MTTPTTEAVPSKQPVDLLFNAEKLDEATNSTSSTFTDRFGRVRRTLTGMLSYIDSRLDFSLAPMAAAIAQVAAGVAVVQAGITPANTTLSPRTSDSELHTFGDSQTAGSNAATGVYYTDGVGHLLPQYRWPNILAAAQGNNLTLYNHGIGGQRLGYANDAPWSMFNQMGKLPPYAGGFEAPKWIVIMGGWNSINTSSSDPLFFRMLRRQHESNIVRALGDHWGGVSPLGWADTTLGGNQDIAGSGGNNTPGFSSTGSFVNDGMSADPASFVPFPTAAPGTEGRGLTRLTNGEYSQFTPGTCRDVFVVLETDPDNQGTAIVWVKLAGESVFKEVKRVGCYWRASYSVDRWQQSVRLKDLPDGATVRVSCDTDSPAHNVRFLAFVWTLKETDVAARRRSITYCSTVANSWNGHAIDVLYINALQAQAAVAAYADYGVMFANVFNTWVQATDQETGPPAPATPDGSHFTPTGNVHVARSVQQAYSLAYAKSVLTVQF